MNIQASQQDITAIVKMRQTKVLLGLMFILLPLLLYWAKPLLAATVLHLTHVSAFDPNDPNDPNDPVDPNDPFDPNDPNSIVLADINKDEFVNLLDFEILSSNWLSTDCNVPDWCGGADMDLDHCADMNDLCLIAEDWLLYYGIVVPDVVGMSQSSATSTLIANELLPGVIGHEPHALIAAGRVMRQDPAAGQPAEPNTPINMVISAGPTYFYVSKQGSDQNNGRYPTNQGGGNGPFATIQKGFQILAGRDAGGDILSIRSGTYYEECTNFGGINPPTPVVIENYNGETVIIDGGEPVTGWRACGLYEPNLAIDGVMPPNWASYYTSVYKADVDASVPYAVVERPYYGVKLVYDNQLRFPCGVLDMPYAVFPDLENTGWTMTSATTTTLRDAGHLTQASDYWNGAFVWFIGGTDNVAYAREIADFDSASDTLVFDPCPAGINKARKYWICNHPHYLNTAGEYYWEPNSLDGNYTVYYYKKPAETVSDLNSKMKVLSKSAGIRLSVSSANLLIRGLHFQNCQTHGDIDHLGNIIPGGPIGQCGFICGTNWCNSISNITVQNCAFRNFYGNDGGAIVFGECENDIVIQGCTFSDIGRGTGIRLYGVSDDKVDGVTIENCVLARIWGSNIRPYFATDVRITGNVITQFDGVHGNAVTVYGSCDNVLVAHNFITGGTNALVMKDTYGMYILGNVFRSSDESGSVSMWDVDYRAVSGNLYILQNTILTSSATQKKALFLLDQNNGYLPTNASVIVKNNILDGFEYAADWNAVVSHDYNLYLEASTHQLGTCSSCLPWVYGSHERTNMKGHTQEFLDYPSEDYRIRTTSRAFHSGAHISAEMDQIEDLFPSYDCRTDMEGTPWGPAPSMGAFEVP